MASARWSTNALGNLEKLDPIIRERILTKVSWLEENLADIVPEPLHRELKGSYKLRMGDYRVVYSVHQELITIEAVGHRRDVYK
ncbi:MAG: type II toxin-antitoxin system RelE/ParE family toxin [Patescibacteria group bacterium]